MGRTARIRGKPGMRPAHPTAVWKVVKEVRPKPLHVNAMTHDGTRQQMGATHAPSRSRAPCVRCASRCDGELWVTV